MRPGRQRGGLETGRYITGQLIIPAALHLRFHRHALQGIDTGHGFDQEGLVFGAAVKLLVQPRAQQRRDQQGNPEIQWQRGQHNQREPTAIEQHHSDEHHREQHVQYHGDGIAGEEGTNVLQLSDTGN